MTTDKTSPLLDGQYPTTWSAYVGQDEAKDNLRTMAESARLRGDKLPHIIISSPYAGIGKTALALLTCRESGRTVWPVSGAMKAKDAMNVFEDARDGDIVFYDEFHTIANGGKAGQEWLLNYLENGTILMPYGPEEVPDVTFLAATTDKGMLLPTVLDRFTHVDLDPYTDAEAADIAIHLSSKVLGATNLPTISRDVAVAVARAGSNQPRRMRDLIKSLRDLATVGTIAVADDGQYALERALRFAGLTEDGLTKEAVKYLQLMKREMRREPAGEAVLKARLGYGRGEGLKMVELLLVGKGFIAHTKQGRMLTSAGSSRAKELLAEAA